MRFARRPARAFVSFARANHTRTMATPRTYAEAVARLNSLQSNAATLDAMRAAGSRMAEFAIPEMVEYLERVGYQTADLDRLNVLHVTGTKGKGSTCAFASALLARLRPDAKIGLYTSPHLVAVRERIRVNGAPLSEAQFARFFFEVWDRLEANTTRRHESTPAKPMYFRFVTLVAYHAFLSLNVDATILEVGVGGRFDSTNIVPKPVVTGITALGIDHVGVLGRTLPEIAWQKAGIYKAGVPALTVEQPAEAMAVLQEEATKAKASTFEVVPTSPALATARLGLAGAHQVQNASLAVALVKEFVRATTGRPLDAASEPALSDGLAAAKWPGRCQTVQDPAHSSTRWFLDGAHTLESLDCCAAWFFSPGVGLSSEPSAPRSRKRVLIFNCTSGRTGGSFLELLRDQALARSHAHGHAEPAAALFDAVVFCANVTYADGQYKGDLTTHAVHDADLAALTTQQDLAAAWRALVPGFPPAAVHVLPSIEHAVRVVRGLDAPVDVLVTGSLHLVGGVIEVAGLADVAL